jgi:PAS domain S-box-containing protein
MKPKAEKLCALLESAPDAKRAEEALIEERHLLHTLMDNLPDLIYFKDRESRFTRINLAHANAFGLSHPDQAVGKSDFDFFTPEHAQEAYGDEQEIIRTGQPIVGKEEKETWPDGRVTWVSTTKMPLRNPHGDITGTFGVSCDITQRKRAEEALRRSEEKYRSFVSNIPDVAWTMDARLHIAFISPNIERISGYTLDEVYGQGARLFLDSVHPDDLQNVREGFEALFAKNQPYDVECRLRRKNGEWIWMHDRALKTYEKDGIRCADGLLSDITERKRAEAALRESETKYRTIFESAADAIFLFDGHGFVQCSERALELFRCTRDHIVGQTPDAISPAFQPDGSDSKQSAREISRRAFSGEKVAFEWQYRRPDGTLFDSETRLSSLQIDGETYLLAVVSDITERKRAEAEMTERHRLATLVAEVGRVLTQSETLRQGLQQCTEILVHNIGAAFARVWTVNEEENVLELQASAGIYTHLDGSHARVPVGKFKIGRIAESCEPHLTNSVLEDPWVGDAEWARREGIVAFAGYPLKVEEHVLGVVAAFARQPLMETTLQAFASVADSIAQFIRRKHAEQQTALQTVALESAANGIVIASRDGRINWVNPAFTRLTGYPAAEVIGKNPRFLKSGIHDKAFYQKLWNTILSGEVWQGELVNRRKDGTRYPEEMTITPVRDAQGTLSHFIAIKQDITARKRAEQDLLFKTALLEAQSETTIDGILVVDMTGQVLLVNRQFAKMWGFPEETIRTKDDRMLIEHLRGQVKDPEAFVERVHYLYTHKAERSRDEIELKSGRIFDRYSSPLQDSTGKHYGRIWYFRDITGRREIDRLKSELVSVVSHELRTPLTSIRGALGLLAGGLLRSQPEKGKRMLEIAISNTDRLVRLINDILDLERMESGKMNMEKRPCIATDMMTEAADNVRELAEKAGVTLSVSPYPSRIWVDPDRLIQAFVNLLSNAIKFSARGGTVWLSATPQANQILFQVKDQGRGIPQEKLESIFERFQQVDASDRREKGGTGLGLPITRSIVQQHGGRICVKSTLGQGTTFSFTLPSLPAETTLPADGLATRKVLMCAVEADICNTVPAALKQGGYTVMVSSSWHEAVETATLDRPEAILLDSSLPGMEGLEPIDAFKQNSDTQDIPLIGLGGKAPSEVQLAAMGMAGWIAKPLNEISLIQGLEPVLAKASDRPRVLLIEDDADLAGVLTTVFERHGAVVFHAQTGQEGVQICPKFIPDLLVLDVLLPELDGFGVVEQLRQYENLRRLPVAVYSVKELNDSEKARLRLGESIFLTKSRLTPQEFEERAIGLLSWATSGQRERRRG